MLDELAGELQNAIASGNFQAAQQLAEKYGKNVQMQIQSAADARDRERIWSDALQVLQHHLVLTRIVRSHIAARLQTAAGQVAYHPALRDRHTWRLDV